MSLLSKVERGVRRKPLCIVFYGAKGIGKSSFPLGAPNPIYLGSEDNSELNAAKFPQVRKWADFEQSLAALVKEDHNYKTLVIDTVDNLQEIAELEILSKEPGKTMATAFGGYGKAYEKMANMFLHVRESYLKVLRETKGMNIVLLAHADKTKHEDPITGGSWDNFQTSIHKKIKPIFEDWSSAILFANYHVEEGKKENHFTGDGTRYIWTQERPSHAAKNRFDLPLTLDFKKDGAWANLIDLIEKFYAKYGNSEEIKREIEELLPNMPEEVRPKVLELVAKAGENSEELNKIVARMRGYKQG
jgi:hypothetical protein